MKRAFLVLVALSCAMGLMTPCYGVTITWGAVQPAVDSLGVPLKGTSEFGTTPTMSMGSLVQLWKVVGTIDDPRNVSDAYANTTLTPQDAGATGVNWHIDDVLLGSSHVGFGHLVSDNGTWSQRGDYAISGPPNPDELYVRVYNVPEPDWDATPLFGSAGNRREVGIRNTDDLFVTQILGAIRDPDTLIFDNLATEPIPEPAPFVLLTAGLLAWALRRKRQAVLPGDA